MTLDAIIASDSDIIVHDELNVYAVGIDSLAQFHSLDNTTLYKIYDKLTFWIPTPVLVSFLNHLY